MVVMRVAEILAGSMRGCIGVPLVVAQGEGAAVAGAHGHEGER